MVTTAIAPDGLLPFLLITTLARDFVATPERPMNRALRIPTKNVLDERISTFAARHE
jgi:hypothetical protein